MNNFAIIQSRRKPFNLFISLAEYKFDFPVFSIDLFVEMTPSEFACLFGQIWKCYPQYFFYDKNILLCNLRKFWTFCKNKELIDSVSNSFVNQYNDLSLDSTVSYQNVYSEFIAENGIFYDYFHERHEDGFEEGYSQISYELDVLINRECFKKQLFYYDCCTRNFPNLVIGSKISLKGRIIINKIPVDVTLHYKIISEHPSSCLCDCSKDRSILSISSE